MVDVLFITDDFRIEPLGIGYISSSLNKERLTTDLIKFKNKKSLNEIISYLHNGNSNQPIIAYSVMTNKYNFFTDLNKQIKSVYPSIKSVIGGVHPTCSYESIDDSFDYIIKGEAEQSMVNLVKSIKEKKMVNRIIDFVPLEENLDSIPFPDRQLVYKYVENYFNPIKYIFAMRGCSFSCTYCFNHLYKTYYDNQRWVRFRSPENIVNECKEIINQYPVQMFYFHEDDFLLHQDLGELLEMYKTKIDKPYHCQFRIEHLTNKHIKMFKETGCYSVTFGLEAGNDYIRKEILNRNVSKEKIVKGCEMLRNAGIKYRIFCMCGIPKETIDTMIETLNLCIKCKPVMNRISIYQPYPHQLLSNLAVTLKLWDGKISSIKDTYFEDTILNFSDKFKRQIKSFHRLFGFITENVWLLRFINILISIPNNFLYEWIYRWNRRKDYRKLFNVKNLYW